MLIGKLRKRTMVNQEIVNYIREGKKRGFNISLLRGKLKEGGFSNKEIDEGISFSNNEGNPAIMKPAPKFVNSAGGKPTPMNVKQSGKVQSEKGGGLGLFKKIKMALAHPSDLFRATKGEGIWSAFKFYLITAIVPFVFLTIIFSFMASIAISSLSLIMGDSPILEYLAGGTILLIAGMMFVGVYIFGPIGLFVFGGIQHLILKLFKGQGSFSNTFNTLVYSYTPNILFGWILPINFIFGIWSFVLLIFGISINHNISKLKAFLSLIVLPVIFLLIWVILFLVFGISGTGA